MENFEELQSRVMAAMNRIGEGLEGLQAPPEPFAPSESPEELAAALAEERDKAASLEVRLGDLEAEKAATDAELSATKSALEEAQTLIEAAEKAEQVFSDAVSGIADMESEINRLREVSEQLRENNRALRESLSPDGQLLDAGLSAELEALRADRAAAKVQADAILAALVPLVSETGKEG